MSKLCCITDLIRFMMKEAENLTKGSVYEDDLFIVHDALVLMTAKETIEWMKEKNFFHFWLLYTTIQRMVVYGLLIIQRNDEIGRASFR